MDLAGTLAPERADFLRRLQNGTCSHGFIVEGPKGSGKKAFALWCASALLCESADKPCGVCRSCRKVQGRHHPDVHLYGGGDKAITVGQVRDLIKETGWIPTDGEKNVFILENAQKMQAPAQNALLKVFEEPPAGVVIFLLTDSRRGLLPTVRSRGQTVRLSPMEPRDMEAKLKLMFPRVSPGELSAAVAYSRGSLGEAEEFLKRDAVMRREAAAEWLTVALDGDKYRLIGLLTASKHKRDTLLPLLDSFLQLLFDLLLEKSGGQAVLLTEEQREFYGNRATKRAIAAMCDVTIACRESLESNGNVTAVMTRLATGLWSAANERG